MSLKLIKSFQFLNFARFFLLRCWCYSLSFFTNFQRFDLRILRIRIFSCWTSLLGLRCWFWWITLFSFLQITAFLTFFINKVAFNYKILNLVFIPDFILVWKILIIRFLWISELIPHLRNQYTNIRIFKLWILFF
jgi:hypothetical protein